MATYSPQATTPAGFDVASILAIVGLFLRQAG
jgi:hypothetical protein